MDKDPIFLYNIKWGESYPRIPLLTCTMWNGTSTVLLRAPTSLILLWLGFECRAVQHCRLAGVDQGVLGIITESHVTAVIPECCKHNNKQTQGWLIGPNGRTSRHAWFYENEPDAMLSFQCLTFNLMCRALASSRKRSLAYLRTEGSSLQELQPSRYATQWS